MIKNLTILFRRPILIVFIIICAIYIPGALVKPSESSSTLLIATIGIDINADTGEYEISALINVPAPGQSYKEAYAICSGKGDTVYNAIRKLTANRGQKLDVNHVHVIIVTEDFLKKNAVEDLDYFIRTNNVSENVALISTDKKALELLKTSKDTTAISGIKLEDYVEYNKAKTYSTELNLGSFYHGFFSKEKVSIIQSLTLEKEEEEKAGGGPDTSIGGSSSGGESGGSSGSSSSSSSQKKQKIINNGEAIILKNGEYVTKLSYDEKNGINWLLPTKNFAEFKIKNFSDENFTDAEISFKVDRKQSSSKFEINKDFLKLKETIQPLVKITEVRQNKTTANILQGKKVYFTEKMQQAIQTKIKEDVGKLIEDMQKNNYDAIDLYTEFYETDKDKFLAFLEKIGEEDSYLNHIIFEIEVIPRIIY